MSEYKVDERELITEIRELIINDKVVKDMIPAKNVRLHIVPEELHSNPPIIRISQLDMLPTEYADNEQLAWFYMFQIDVWHDESPFIIAQHINRIMKSINFRQSTPVFGWDEDTELLRDGRGYEGIIRIKE